MPTHASASLFFGVAGDSPGAPSVSACQTGSQPPQAGAKTLRPPDSQSVPGGFVRASLRHAPPRTSLRSALHTLAALRPSQRLRAPAPPPCCARASLHIAAPPSPTPAAREYGVSLRPVSVSKVTGWLRCQKIALFRRPEVRRLWRDRYWIIA